MKKFIVFCLMALITSTNVSGQEFCDTTQKDCNTLLECITYLYSPMEKTHIKVIIDSVNNITSTKKITDKRVAKFNGFIFHKSSNGEELIYYPLKNETLKEFALKLREEISPNEEMSFYSHSDGGLIYLEWYVFTASDYKISVHYTKLVSISRDIYYTISIKPIKYGWCY